LCQSGTVHLRKGIRLQPGNALINGLLIGPQSDQTSTG
jgi:hypothetical protein